MGDVLPNQSERLRQKITHHPDLHDAAGQACFLYGAVHQFAQGGHWDTSYGIFLLGLTVAYILLGLRAMRSVPSSLSPPPIQPPPPKNGSARMAQDGTADI